VRAYCIGGRDASAPGSHEAARGIPPCPRRASRSSLERTRPRPSNVSRSDPDLSRRASSGQRWRTAAILVAQLSPTDQSIVERREKLIIHEPNVLRQKAARRIPFTTDRERRLAQSLDGGVQVPDLYVGEARVARK